MNRRADVIVIGAGIAGICCARRLAEAGFSVRLLEATASVGGRTATRVVDGYRLDRCAPLLVTSYPEVQRLVDRRALDLRPFRPVAVVRVDRTWRRVAGPWHEPLEAVRGLRGFPGSAADRIRAALWTLKLCAGTPEAIVRRRERSAEEFLRKRFSDTFVDRFFRPLAGAVFLDRRLSVSSRWLEWSLRMLATGRVAVPARGMGDLGIHLAAGLPGGALRLRSRVTGISGGRVRVEDGSTWEARAIVVATSEVEAEQLMRLDRPPGIWREARSWWFSAVAPPHLEPWLYLDGDGSGPVNHAVVCSNLSREYAPPGRALIHAVSLPAPGWDSEHRVRFQLREWFGPITADWQLVHSEHFRHALPAAAQIEPHFTPLPSRIARNLFVCGDHRATASIDGAMLSGRCTADEVIAELAAIPVQPEML